MTSPLRLSFEVGCRPQAAFRLWTEAIGTWWPADHTVSGDPATVVFEGRVGDGFSSEPEMGLSTSGVK
jgi:hypothetical protein